MTTLLFYNFKGGIGKTSLSAIIGYQLVQKNYSVLLVDCDAQANLTDIISKTYDAELKPERNFFESLNAGNLVPSIVKVNNNLDIIPSDWSMSLWNQSVEKINVRQRNVILKALLEPIKANYDFIIIDVPPTLSTIVNNAVLAADAIAIVLQTQQAAFTGALKTAAYLEQLREDYNASFKLTGIILYLMKKNGAIDAGIAKTAKSTFKNGIFANEIYTRERVKRWGNKGISDADFHDKNTQYMYSMVLKELLYRMKELGVEIK